MEEIFSLGNEKWLSKERNGKKGEINVLFSLLYRQIVRQAGWPEIALQIETQLGQKLYKFSYDFLPTAHRDAFCKFFFRWIYYCDSGKSAGKETDKTHPCVHCPFARHANFGIRKV